MSSFWSLLNEIIKMKLNHILFVMISMMSIEVDSISNGNFVSIKDAPFYVSVTSNDAEICGGSIVSEFWIISAAHCFLNVFADIPNTRIRSRSSTDFMNQSTYQIETVIISEDYTGDSGKTTGSHDIALVKLEEPIIFNKYQQPIKIAQDPPKDNDTATLYGLRTQNPNYTDASILEKLEVNVINQEKCQSMVGSFLHVTNDVFCVGEDVCPGDSGGPVVIDGKLAGIVSFGYYCQFTNRRMPSSHTRVHKYYDWIVKHTRIKY